MRLRFVTMTIQVELPEEIVARIDSVAPDRAAFVVEAVRNLLRESETGAAVDETARINEVADELNREAADVLEYQVIP
jgi:metal-responsive CopG/Arc/MetJ family transcriptional regulator